MISVNDYNPAYFGKGTKLTVLALISVNNYPAEFGSGTKLTVLDFISVNNLNPAYFGSGTKLTVLEREVAEPNVIVLPPSEKECRNKKDPQKKKTLVCVAEDFYPDHVSLYWQVDGENVTDGVATDNFAQQNETSKLYKITSRLRVSATDWFTSGKEFKCIVSFIRPNDTQEIYPASVEGVKPPDTDAMTRETFLKISQSAKLCYGVFIAKSCLYGAFVMFLVWKLQGSTGK